MKKLIIFCACAALFGITNVSAEKLYVQSFKGAGFPAEYTIMSRGHGISVDEIEGNKFGAIKINMPASQGSPYYETKIPVEENAVIELSVRVKNSDALSQSAVIIKNSAGQTANVLVMQKGNIYAGNGTTLIKKIADGDTFYDVAIALNFKKGTYSVYSDGQKKAKDISFGTTFSTMDMSILRFMTLSLKDGCHSEFGVDNIEVYSADEPLSEEEKSAMETVSGGVNLVSVRERVKNVLFFYENTDKMYYKAQILTMPHKAFYENDNLYIPLRYVIESLGGVVGWNNGEVTVEINGKTESFKTDGKEVISRGGTTFLSTKKLALLMGTASQTDKTGFSVVGDEKYFYDWETEQDMILETVGYINYERPDGYEIAADVIKKSAGVHPRVVAEKTEIEAIKRAVANGEEPVAGWFLKVKDVAKRELNEPVYEFKMQDNIRALGRIQQVLNRINRLGLVYHVTGEKAYAKRGIEEVMGFCGDELWPDWNPYQMLGMGEAAYAAAIGYDWFYDDLTEEERGFIKKAIREKAFVHYMNDINELTTTNGGVGRPSTPYAKESDWLVRSTLFKPLDNNWNSIVNGGILSAALTICDSEDSRKISEEILGYSIIEMEKGMKGFAPDGAWYEGAGYWNYMMQYVVRTWKALDKACGTDYGLSNAPAMKLTADYIFGVQGPGGTFNFSDANASKIVGDNIFYIARKYNLPNVTRDAEKLILSQAINAGVDNITDYLFAPKKDLNEESGLDNYWRTIETVTLRNSWDVTSANFIGIHGGSNEAIHAHLDTGSIVLDALGTRIIEDIGSENYNLKSKGGTGGFLLYRLNPQGHNMICFNPSTMAYGQNVKAGSYITDYRTNKIDAFAITDLSDVWSEFVNEYKRGIRLTDDRNVFVIQDEYKVKPNVEEMYWFAHTTGDIEISEDKKSAKITVDNVELNIELMTDTDGEFMELPALPFEGSESAAITGQNQNIKYKKLAFKFNKIEDGTFAVACIPGRKGMPVLLYDAPEFAPLSEWELTDDTNFVREESRTLSGILVNGEPISDFDPEVKKYRYYLPYGSTEIPKISVKETDAEIYQAESYLGAAYVVIDKNIYTVSFEKEIRIGENDSVKEIPVKSIWVSDEPQEANCASNINDGNPETRWSALAPCSVIYDLGEVKKIDSVGLSWYLGNEREAGFEIYVSDDNENWERVHNGFSTGITTEPEYYDIKDSQGRFVKVQGMSSTNSWISITEMKVFQRK